MRVSSRTVRYGSSRYVLIPSKAIKAMKLDPAADEEVVIEIDEKDGSFRVIRLDALMLDRQKTVRS